MLTSKTTQLLVGGLLLASCPAAAQAPAVVPKLASYLVTSQGDTLRGQLTVPRLATRHGVTLRTSAQATRHFEAQELRVVQLPDGRQLIRRALAAGRNPNTGAVDSATVLLQPLVAGAATLYRYDAAADPQSQTAQEASGAIQYLVELSSHNLVRLRPATYQTTLAALLKDCPAVAEAVPRTTFDPAKLADLLLRYTTQCHASTPAHDYRPIQPPNPLRLLVSLRAGVQQGKLFYEYGGPLAQTNAQATTAAVVGLELRLANAGPWSLTSGLQYLWHRNETASVQPARLGTTNVGQPLVLPAAVSVQQLQVPVLVRYTLGKRPLQPYLAAGPTFGFYYRNQTQFSYTTLTYVGGTPSYYREDVVEEAVVRSGVSTHFVVGGSLRAGLRFKMGARLAPLLEVQYNAGRDSSYNPGLLTASSGAADLGNLHYQSLGVLFGIEF
jgi:hypothetical protein